MHYLPFLFIFISIHGIIILITVMETCYALPFLFICIHGIIILITVMETSYALLTLPLHLHQHPWHHHPHHCHGDLLCITCPSSSSSSASMTSSSSSLSWRPLMHYLPFLFISICIHGIISLITVMETCYALPFLFICIHGIIILITVMATSYALLTLPPHLHLHPWHYHPHHCYGDLLMHYLPLLLIFISICIHGIIILITVMETCYALPFLFICIHGIIILITVMATSYALLTPPPHLHLHPWHHHPHHCHNCS